MCKDVFTQCADQVRGPCEKGVGAKLLKADSIQITKVPVCHVGG